MNFDFAFAAEILPDLIKAARLTLLATVGGMAIALVWGLVLAVCNSSRHAWVRLPGVAYVELVRNTPFLIQLYLVFYVLPDLGITAPALVTGILALGMNYSAYTAEVYRSGIQGVPSGQWEAAHAVTLTRARTWRSVILPQAVRPVVPVLGNYFIGMLKETPLLSTIAVLELFGTAQVIAGRTYQYTEPYTAMGIIFLLLSIPSALAIQALERRIKRGAASA